MSEKGVASMKSLSARQQEFDFSVGLTHASIQDVGTTELYTSRESPSGGGALGALTNFNFSSDLVAQASRRAGRLNASSISEQEVQDLLCERQMLLDKKFNETMTQLESNR